MNERDTDKIIDDIMECGCEREHASMIKDFMEVLVMGIAVNWPMAAHGEFSLMVHDKDGNPVVKYGGSIPEVKPTNIGNN